MSRWCLRGRNVADRARVQDHLHGDWEREDTRRGTKFADDARERKLIFCTERRLSLSSGCTRRSRRLASLREVRRSSSSSSHYRFLWSISKRASWRGSAHFRRFLFAARADH